MGKGFQTHFLMQWARISTKYSSCAQGVMVFDSTWGEKAVGSANLKKKSEGNLGQIFLGTGPSDFFLELADPTAFSLLVLSNTIILDAKLEY